MYTYQLSVEEGTPGEDHDSLRYEYPDHKYAIAFLVGIILLEIAIGILYGFFMRNTDQNSTTET